MSVYGSRVLERFSENNKINPEQVNSASIDLTIGNEITLIKWTKNMKLDNNRLIPDHPSVLFYKSEYFEPENIKQTIDLSLFDHEDKSKAGIWVPPGVGILLHTAEYVKMPTQAAGLLLLKSSRGREFWQHAMAGWVDNGFEGQLVLEVYAPAIPIHIYAGQRAVQLTLHDVEGVGFHYGMQKDAHYQGQTGVTPSWASEGLHPSPSSPYWGNQDTFLDEE